MEWLLLVLLGGGAALAAQHVASQRRARHDNVPEHTGVRRLVHQDLVLFGRDLTALGERLTTRDLGASTRADYQGALDAYESAQRSAALLGDDSRGIIAVTDALAIGRYRLACARARFEGRPAPEPRVPCFVNPQHGPSVTDAEWLGAPDGARIVALCAEDAARIASLQAPDIRTVTLGSRTVPYWEVGDDLMPYRLATPPTDP